MFERRLYFYFDWALLAAVLTLCVIGVAMVYSATYDPTTQSGEPLFRTQLIAIGIGLVALLACLTIDYRTLANNALLLYGMLVALLVYVLAFGPTIAGTQRWIPVGGLSLQPSEFAKVVVAIVLAMLFGESRGGSRTVKDLLLGAAFVALPMILIARQPDLGTAAVLVPLYLGVAYAAGLRLRFLATIGLVGLLLVPVVWTFALRDYQKTRIVTFLNPELDARGAGYQQIQARITVGSGGLTGKGYLQGTQGQYKFLPVAHNDFIFSVLAEEQGFLGVLFTLGLYLFVILRGIETARLSKDRVGAYLVVGVLSVFSFQVLYTVAMSAGLAPVKGLTLPLLSYGGSSVIATMAGFGLVLNVRMRRFSN
jgi:rod shape determining protein RodA